MKLNHPGYGKAKKGKGPATRRQRNLLRARLAAEHAPSRPVERLNARADGTLDAAGWRA